MKLCLPFLRFIGDAVMIEGSKHLNPQDSIQEQEEEQKMDTLQICSPDRLRGSEFLVADMETS